MPNRAEIAARWTEGLSSPDKAHLEAVKAVLDPDVVTVNPLGTTEGRKAVLAAFGKSVLAPAFATGTWSAPKVTRDDVTATCTFTDTSVAVSATVRVTVDKEGRICRVETTIDQSRAASPAPVTGTRELLESQELKDALIRNSDLSGARLRNVNVSNVSIDTWAGRIVGLTINDVEVGPLVEAELDRRHPERLKLKPSTAQEVLDAFDAIEAMWTATIERARALPETAHHVRVEGEYSFLETLRHLLFATDAWLTRMVLQVPNAYHEWGVLPDDGEGRLSRLLPLGSPPDDGPCLDEVLDVRTERMSRLRDYLVANLAADLTEKVSPPDTTGFPQGKWPIIDCFRLILSEEWWHHRYAVRDLAVLESS